MENGRHRGRAAAFTRAASRDWVLKTVRRRVNERLSSSTSKLDRARRLIISPDARGQGPALRVSGVRGAVEWSRVECTA